MFTTVANVLSSLACLVLVMLVEPASAAGSSILVAGNLILVNPLQSSVIFVVMVVSSVGIEAIMLAIEKMENRHLKVTLRLFVEEVVVLGLAEVGLLTVDFTFSAFNDESDVIFLTVALVLVYLAIAYGLINVTLAVVLQSRGKSWRTFEWGRLEADAHHNAVERLFKLARRWFVRELHRVVAQNRQKIAEVPPIAFSVFLARVERKLLRSIFDITFVSWSGLGAMIVVNMCRALLIGSTSVGWEVHSFILVVGYGGFAVFALILVVIRHRLHRFLSHALMHEVSGKQAGESTTVKESLAFGSFEVTLQLFKIHHVCMLWYIAVYIVIEAELSYEAHGWYCFLVGIEAALPVVAFYYLYPNAIFVALMAVALGSHVDEDAVAALQQGCAVNENASSGSDLDEDEALERRAIEEGAATRMDTVRVRHVGTILNQDDDERLPCDDEPEESFGTFHDKVPEEQVPPGEPTRVMGVPPSHSSTSQQRKWAAKQQLPVFL